MFQMPKACRLHWDAELGWVIDVPTAITARQLDGIVQWALPRYRDKWRSLPPGDRKRELGLAIEKLETGELRQRVVNGDDGYAKAFESTERTKPKSIFIPGT